MYSNYTIIVIVSLPIKLILFMSKIQINLFTEVPLDYACSGTGCGIIFSVPKKNNHFSGILHFVAYTANVVLLFDPNHIVKF